MADRLDRFHETTRATRHLLGWFGVAAASIALAVLSVSCEAHGAEADEGWYRITHAGGALHVDAVAAPASGEASFEGDTRTIHVPGVRMAEGTLQTLMFKRGFLAPQVDHAYNLLLGDTAFTLTVSNGLRSRNGIAYGEGAVYTVHVGDTSYSYRLQGGAGWETRLIAVADFDSDGKPDFIVQIGDQEALLLSSRAQPGLNPPAAVIALEHDGC